MSCLDNIISVKDRCNGDNSTSLSGLDLFDAPEISTNTLANVANEEYVTGLSLARDKVRLATILVRNDLMSVMAGNRVLPNLLNTKYLAGSFKPETQYPAAPVNRGLVLHRNSKIRGKLRKITIHNIYVYPMASASQVELKIYDDYAGGTATIYTVDLVANQQNVFPVEYAIKGTFAQVLLNGTDIPVASTFLTCFTGCNGKMPNDCGYVKGFYDQKEISGKEGFGINIDFSCKCDYEELICDLAPLYLGELVWLKSRILFVEETLKTDRLNNFTVFGRENTEAILSDINAEYSAKWGVFAQSLPNILQGMKDDCLDCRGIKWYTST